ncbi:MAG: prephenate dehydrogenase [Thermoleophilaceae bacterium]
MRIAVLGVGLIGGSIGLAARRHLPHVEVAGYDRDDAVLAAALDRGAVSEPATSVAAAVDRADACFACAPVGALPGLVGEALTAASAGCVVTDVGSTKQTIVEAIADERFVGGHPIAGSESQGVEASREDLFDGATWYLTPGARSSGVLYGSLHALLGGLGATPVAIAPEAHDRLMATVSHLPHVIANVLVEQAADPAFQQLPRVGPSFRDLTRVAGANSDIWTDIYMSNADAIADAIDAMGGRLDEIASLLRTRDAAAMERWNEWARVQRNRMLEVGATGGRIYELRVSVPNRPGVVAELAVALGSGGVNITDMRLAPAPDNRSGAISFWVSGERSRARAAALIEALGFPVASEQ